MATLSINLTCGVCSAHGYPVPNNLNEIMESDEEEDLFNEQTWLKDIDDQGTKYNLHDFLSCRRRENHTKLLKLLQSADREQDVKKNVSGKPAQLYNISDKIDLLAEQLKHSLPVENSTTAKDHSNRCINESGRSLRSITVLQDYSVTGERSKNLNRTYEFSPESVSKQGLPCNDLSFNMGSINENILAVSPPSIISNRRRSSHNDFSLGSDLNRTFTLLNSDCSIDGDLNMTFTLDTDEDNSDIARPNSSTPTKLISPKLLPEKLETRKLSKMKAASQDNLMQEEGEVILKNTICRASTSNLLNNNFNRNSKLSILSKDRMSTSDGTLNACHQVRPTLQTGAIPKQRLSNINNIPVNSKEGLQTRNASYMKHTPEKNIDGANNVECATVKNNATLATTQDNRGTIVRRFGSRLPMPVSRSSAVSKRSNLPVSKDNNRNAK